MKNRTLVAIAVSAALAAGGVGCKAGYEAAYERGYEAGYEAGRDDPKSIWELTHNVVRVIDGDTLVLENGEKVRLIGIDAPEKRGDEPLNAEAAEKLEGLVLGVPVRIERDQTIRGPHGRLLAYLYIDDIFVNRELV
ncbi:thermonuclease family protein, partial [Candidatus Woesearchaeota archaeon]|nr:thermonuclease family protein [Candidatus Woesearchaeota archaeon]